MSKREKIVIVMVCFVVLALYDIGGNVFTDGLYSSLAFFLCYIFVSFDSMRRINIMSLYRYRSLGKMYIQMMKERVAPIFIYTFLFMMVGVASELLGLFSGRGIFVSFQTRVKFFIFSYLNLFILNYMLIVLRMLYGKWVSLIAACSCIFISIIQLITNNRLMITPFIFNSAYYRGKMILTVQTFFSYLLCFILIAFITFLSMKKDKTVSQ